MPRSLALSICRCYQRCCCTVLLQQKWLHGLDGSVDLHGKWPFIFTSTVPVAYCVTSLTGILTDHSLQYYKLTCLLAFSRKSWIRLLMYSVPVKQMTRGCAKSWKQICIQHTKKKQDSVSTRLKLHTRQTITEGMWVYYERKETYYFAESPDERSGKLYYKGAFEICLYSFLLVWISEFLNANFSSTCVWPLLYFISTVVLQAWSISSFQTFYNIIDCMHIFFW